MYTVAQTFAALIFTNFMILTKIQIEAMVNFFLKFVHVLQKFHATYEIAVAIKYCSFV